MTDGEEGCEGGGFGDQQGVEVGVELLGGDQLAAAGVEDRCLGAGRGGLGEQAEGVVAALGTQLVDLEVELGGELATVDAEAELGVNP